MANLEGMEGMEPLKGASWGRGGVVSGVAVAVWAGGMGGCAAGMGGCAASICCGVMAGGW